MKANINSLFRALVLVSVLLLSCNFINAQRSAGSRKAAAKTNAAAKATVKGNGGFGHYTTAEPGDETFTVKGVTFVMKGVRGGVFTMGADEGSNSDAYDDERPAHRVAVSSFRIGETVVTQRLWRAVLGDTPSNFKGDDLPVDCVGWYDCLRFITKLNSLTGKKFRLPTEAEWEYAARGGAKSRGYAYSGGNNLDEVAFYGANSDGQTAKVASKKANELGIYDMSGNIFEWCSDWFGSYEESSQTNPQGPSAGAYKVCRGGAWDSFPRLCRTSARQWFAPTYRFYSLGFRLAM